VWLKIFKRHVNRGLAYVDAVEEALCFGWIDGQLRRIDEKSHMIRFTPRRAGSVWAPSNIARVKRLIKQKRMTPAGLKLFKPTKIAAYTAPTAATPAALRIPVDLNQALKRHPIGLDHFRGYPPSYQRTAIWWVKNAKHPDTRTRRIKNIVTNAIKYAKPQF
jgi:uncharacterized protein YdeI (YjbR/CyaY-like superfamily)